ncbi:hypothetical protein V6N13_046822 [Hibiscus sabdariffa]
MSEGSKAINVCSIPTPSSRLSPLARPFTTGNLFNRHESVDPLLGSSSSSTSGLDQPFPYLNLGDQRHRDYYAYHSDSTAITAFPFDNDLDFELNSCFTSYPLEVPPVQTQFTLLTQTSFTPISSSLGNVGPERAVQGAATNHQGLREVPRESDQIATGVSLSCDSPLQQAQTFKPSGASYNAPIVNPVPLENVAYGGTDTVSNMDSYFGYVVPGMVGGDMARSPQDKVACQDLVLTKKCEKRNLVEPVHNEPKNPYIMAKSKLQTTCPNDREDLTVEHVTKASTPDDKWSTNSDDSDVDSPCWKGTQSYKSPLRDSFRINSEDCKGQSSSRVSMSLKLEHSKNEKVARNSLNPLAPVFIPGNSKQRVDHHQKECHGDGFSYTENIGALAVISSSREDGLRDSNKVSTCPSEEINDIGTFWSYEGCDSREGYDTPYESLRKSAANSCCPQPYLGEEYVTPDGQLENVAVAGGMEGTAGATCNALDGVMDIARTGPNSSILFPATEIALNSHSIGDGVFSDLTERFQEPPKSTPPKLDAKLLIKTIEYLSELLLQNYSFALGSMSEPEYDKILNIINNLYVVIRNQAGERAVRPESHHKCTLYDRRQAADHHKSQTSADQIKAV